MSALQVLSGVYVVVQIQRPVETITLFGRRC